MTYHEMVYRNVKALAFLQNRDMKDIEKAVGHTPGFLSRKRNGLDIDTVIKLCKELDVGMDDMLHKDFTHELVKQKSVDDLHKSLDAALQYFEDSELVEMVAAYLATIGGDSDA